MKGKHLKVVKFGTDHHGVRLEGNPDRPEPSHFSVKFPGGEITVTRTPDNEYWAHVHVMKKEAGYYVPGDPVGHIVDARLDIHGRHASECNAGDFADPNLYHLAVRIGRDAND